MKFGWKFGLIGIVLAFSLWHAWPRADRPILNMKLGLDLKGGSHLVMQVITDDAIKAECDITANRTNDALHKAGLTTARVTVGELGEVIVSGIPNGRMADAEAALKEATGWPMSPSGDQIRITMPSTERQIARDRATQQALNTIRNRIDAFGVGETDIRLAGAQKDRVLVELPGVEDPTRVKNVIQTQARLELRLAYYGQDGTGPYTNTKEALLAHFRGEIPPGTEILPMVERRAEGGELFMLVEKASVITGGDLADARPSMDEFNRPNVHFTLRVSAADRFARFTRTNIRRQMPIVLDDKIISAPSINSEIGISGQISGRFSRQEAEDLALNLRSGALPARVVTIEERTVGPSLGKDSIQAGLKSSLWGSLAVCCLMLLYYKRSGINAIIALVFNMVILAACMASFGAVLTLPGIAGYALTVGMAVDSNVLIFERIREELRHGRAVRAAIDLGFSKAFSAIVDTHVTTIVSALFLFGYGTGAVKGFAVALTVGLMANLFTALIVSKLIFDIEIGDRAVQRLSI